MQKIPLSLANEEMILAKPVTRENGMVLIAQGTKLNSKIIDRLEHMGIKQIVVEGNPVDMGNAGQNSSFALRLKRLDHLFRRHDDPWMLKVKKCIQEFYQSKALAEQAASQENQGE